MPQQPRSNTSSLVLLPLLLGLALRAYPIHQYFDLELQRHYPLQAVLDTVRGNWKPAARLIHGSTLPTALHATFTAWCGAGWLTGLYADRLDLLAAFLRDHLPFVIAGRALVVACALWTIYLVGPLGRSLFGEGAGRAGAIFLAVSFIHVRESHHIWPDVPAAAVILTAVAAAVHAARSGRASRFLLAGSLVGAAVATKYSAAPVLLGALLATFLAEGASPPKIVRRLLVTGIGGLIAFAALSPHLLLEPSEMLRTIAWLRGSHLSLEQHIPSLPLSRLTGLCLGWVVTVLALIGLIASVRRAPGPTAIVAAFPVTYLLILSQAPMLLPRYFAIVAPFFALFAGAGAVVVGRGIGRSRARLVTAGIVIAAAAGPALDSIRYDFFVARDDTRKLAGDWIRNHIPPGTPLVLPNRGTGHPNPTLPPNAERLQTAFPQFADALRERGLGDPKATYPTGFLAFFNRPFPLRGSGGEFVVTADHPVAMKGWSMSSERIKRRPELDARPITTFRAVPDKLPPGVIFDRDLLYIPLHGWEEITRPGPNLTIWELPRKASTKDAK